MFGVSVDGTPADVALILNRLNKIYSGMNNSSPIISGFAKWLAVGGVIPDGCETDPKSRGPFEKPCLQQAFRMAGCQASGKAYPQNPSSYANKSWAEIQASFTELYEKMKSTDPAEQDKAVSDCLGIQYYRPPPEDSYTFHQGMDSGGNDIGKGPANDIAKLKSMCDANPSCKGFNTNGWIKHTLQPQSYWSKWTSDADKGTYVKKSQTGYLGCFKDCDGGRALPNNRSWRMSGSPEEKRKTCEALTRAAGDNLFGLQYNHECWSGKDVAYDRMGAAQNCPPTGGGCTQQVYKI
jgi:hypothetical protein